MLASLFALGLHVSPPLGLRLHARRLAAPRAALDSEPQSEEDFALNKRVAARFSPTGPAPPSKADLYDDEALQALWTVHTEFFGDTSGDDAEATDAADDVTPANIMGGLHEAVLRTLATDAEAVPPSEPTEESGDALPGAPPPSGFTWGNTF